MIADKGAMPNWHICMAKSSGEGSSPSLRQALQSKPEAQQWSVAGLLQTNWHKLINAQAVENASTSADGDKSNSCTLASLQKQLIDYQLQNASVH